MTQVELARKAGVNRSKISLYEQGFVELQPKELSKIEKALTVTKDVAGPFSYFTLMDFVALPEDKYKKQIAEICKERKRRRVRAGLSQHELARAMGIQQSKLSEWESGKVLLTDAELEAWAIALQKAG